MGEIMRLIPFKDIVEWSLAEYHKRGSVFGLRTDKFYKNESGTHMEIFGEKISSLLGPAPGPNSQLAQNIIVSYLAGSRFIELKTVQQIDGEALRNAVPRPCIDALDEAYNCEWSTELTVPEAFEEYVKAWFAMHVLAKEFGLADERDFAFNISAGYDYEGITGPKIDKFITEMSHAKGTPIWNECYKYLSENIGNFKHFTKEDLEKVSPGVAPSITLSTLHGCPPAEIEKIANHFLTVKKVHTYIKCNPTLLGYEYARKTLDELGYDYISFTDHHFKNDLQYSDAIPMFTRLLAVAKEQGLEFGVKITNTFPVLNDQGRLPSEEMYMSGRSLYPLSLSVANNLAQDFDGKLAISYSGGADHFNIEKLAAVGIMPITVATTILKPGGYGRMTQLAKQTEKGLTKFSGIDTAKIKALTIEAIADPLYHKESRDAGDIKGDSTLGLFDCYMAPCKEAGCPINQQIPEYINLVSEERFKEAFEIIVIDNPLPGVTGTICDHQCQFKCTRNDYDKPVQIRAGKKLAVHHAADEYIASLKPSKLASTAKVAVVGAGPAGIAVSHFLRRNGMDVTVMEKRDKPYGIVEHIIPTFRLDSKDLSRDVAMAEKLGVTFKYGVDPNYSVADLKKEYDYVVVATGAWKEGRSPVSEGGDKVVDALDFLGDFYRNKENCKLGSKVAVIGAGDVAMDCSRAATRVNGVDEVTIVYRRTREQMPAMLDEIRGAEAEGVKVMELVAPVSYDGKTLTVEVQELTDQLDASGRRTIKGTGKKQTLSFDTVIGAVGARVDSALYASNGLALNDWDMPVVTSSNESSLHNVYVAGDGRSGTSTVVKAIADAKAIAIDILGKAGLAHDFVRVDVVQPLETIYKRKGVLADIKQKGRCLTCDQICEICTDVCPNRANVAITIHKPDMFNYYHQIVHIDGMCNECGNCGTFCPHTGNPYLDKFTLYWTEADFEDSKNRGFLPLSKDTFKVRLENGTVVDYKLGDKHVIPAEMTAMIETLINDYAYYLVKPVM